MKKIISLVLVLVLALTAIGGTLAYFTDTDEVKNEFTIGNVTLDLYEGDEDDRIQDGITFEDAIVPGHIFDKNPTIEMGDGCVESYVFLEMKLNKFNSLFPVMLLDAHADKNINYTISEENLENWPGNTAMLKELISKGEVYQKIIDKWFTGIDHDEWKIVDAYFDTNGYATIRMFHKATMSAGEDTTFMTHFQMPASVTTEMLENDLTQNNFNATVDGEQPTFRLEFAAYAIQKDMIADEAAAYKELFNAEMGAGLAGLAG